MAQSLRRLLLRPPPLPEINPGGAAGAAAITDSGPSTSAPSSPGHAVPLVLLFFLLFLGSLLFLLGFLLRDICRCFGRQPNLRKRRKGIDPAVLDSFPVVLYDAVRRRCGPDCAVCLAEFEGDETVPVPVPVQVRVLTVCGHVFHSECIDLWLESHVTCPICRSDLRREPDEAAVKAILEAQQQLEQGGEIEEMQDEEA